MGDINLERKRSNASLGWILMLVAAVAVVFLLWWAFGAGTNEGAPERQPEQSGSIERVIEPVGNPTSLRSQAG